MIAGHFGFAAVVKSRARATPLWALMLACQWLDVAFVPLFVAGVERIVAAPGTPGTGYGQGIIYADYTHSLLGALLLALAFAGVASIRWGGRSGVLLGAVVFSHWLLDLVVHRGDLPILPGNAGDLPRLGFGLWQLPAMSLVLELSLVLAGAFLYWRAAVATANAGGDHRTKTAHVAGALALVAGLATLAINATGK